MTFRLMSGALVRRFPDASGQGIAGRYFSNSIGAAIGVLVSGFVLLPAVGLPGTVLAAAVLNIALALCVWVLSRQPEWSTSPESRERTSGCDAPAQGTGNGLPRLLLTVAFATGAASFIYEIGWIRMLGLGLVLGASTHAFELMLSAFILGLALGSAWIRNRIDLLADPIRFLGFVQIAMGVLALATIALYSSAFDLMAGVIQGLARNENGYAVFNVSSHAIAIMAMLPVTFCAGMTLPLMTNMLLNSDFGERSIGQVYAANTLGAIAGVIAVVHLLLPLLGLNLLMCVGAAIDLGAGAILLRRAGVRFLPAWVGASVAILLMAATLV
jgi:spermidine synthase